MAKIIDIRDLPATLLPILQQVQAGTEIHILADGQEIARIARPPSSHRRPIGILRGKIQMAADFDQMPSDIVEAMVNGHSHPS